MTQESTHEPATPTTPRTAAEKAILDLVARTNGREWTERHAERILEKARWIGEL